MLISQKMNDKLCEQIANEQYSSQLYLAIAAAFEKMGLKVFAAYYVKQAEEETGHAMKMYKYIVDAGGEVTIKGLPEPKLPDHKVEALVTAARDHEIKVTDMINDLVELADKEKDYATRSFLGWFVDEQVEEVSSADELLTLTKMAGAQVLYLEHRVAQMLG